MVPGGEAWWLASNSCSVIGRVMGHGLLVEVSVTGAHELEAAAALAVNLLLKSLTAVTLHGAMVAAGTASDSLSAESDATA